MCTVSRDCDLYWFLTYFEEIRHCLSYNCEEWLCNPYINLVVKTLFARLHLIFLLYIASCYSFIISVSVLQRYWYVMKNTFFFFLTFERNSWNAILSKLHEDSNLLVALATLKKTQCYTKSSISFFYFFLDFSDVALHQCRIVECYHLLHYKQEYMTSRYC